MFEIVTEFEKTNQRCKNCIDEQGSQKSIGIRSEKIGGALGNGSRTGWQSEHIGYNRRGNLDTYISLLFLMLTKGYEMNSRNWP